MDVSSPGAIFPNLCLRCYEPGTELRDRNSDSNFLRTLAANNKKEINNCLPPSHLNDRIQKSNFRASNNSINCPTKRFSPRVLDIVNVSLNPRRKNRRRQRERNESRRSPSATPPFISLRLPGDDFVATLVYLGVGLRAGASPEPRR